MDDVFRTRYGGIDKPDLNDVQIAYENSEENDCSDDKTPSTVPTGDAVVPAWELPKSPYDEVFRKRVGELKHDPNIHLVYIPINLIVHPAIYRRSWRNSFEDCGIYQC